MTHARRRLPSLLGAIAILTAACGASTTTPPAAPPGSPSASSAPSSSPAPSFSCDPACQVMALQSPAYDAPGELPAGDYTTKAFYPGGLTITLQDGWKSHEDSTGQFSVERLARPDDNLLFWVDVALTTWDGKPVEGVAETPEAVSEWLHAQPETMTVTPAKPTTLGRAKLPAIVMDITLPDDAPQAVGCPVKSCIALFWWPQWDEPYAMSSDMHVRLYLARIGKGPHLLFVLFNVVDADEFAPAAQPILDSLVLSDDLG